MAAFFFSVEPMEKKRRTVALPSILNSYGPPVNGALPKPTATNLRRLSETPVARKAINTIKDRIASMRWRVQPRQGLFVGRDSRRGHAGAHPDGKL